MNYVIVNNNVKNFKVLITIDSTTYYIHQTETDRYVTINKMKYRMVHGSIRPNIVLPAEILRLLTLPQISTSSFETKKPKKSKK